MRFAANCSSNAVGCQLSFCVLFVTCVGREQLLDMPRCPPTVDRMPTFFLDTHHALALLLQPNSISAMRIKVV